MRVGDARLTLAPRTLRIRVFASLAPLGPPVHAPQDKWNYCAEYAITLQSLRASSQLPPLTLTVCVFPQALN